MNGVMTDGVSAGSNQVGASETWTAHVISPSGAAATAPAEPATSTSGTSRTTTVLGRVDIPSLPRELWPGPRPRQGNEIAVRPGGTDSHGIAETTPLTDPLRPRPGVARGRARVLAAAGARSR